MTRRARLMAIVAALAAGCGSGSRAYMMVAAPVADLRTEPGSAAQPGMHDPNEETQLLYGELVRVVKQERGWPRLKRWSSRNGATPSAGKATPDG